MKIFNIGYYPPPYGGVSIHIKRLHESLAEEGFNSFVVDISRTNKKYNDKILRGSAFILLKLFFEKKSIFHFHDTNKIILIILKIFSIRHNVLFSFHNTRYFEVIKKNRWSSIIVRHALSDCRLIILDNNYMFEAAQILLSLCKKFVVIPEFIPPKKIPQILNKKIIELRSNHRFIISSNAWKLCFYDDQDLYGVDLLIELIDALVFKYEVDVACIFLLPLIGDQEYYNKLLKSIQERNLDQKFCFIHEPLEEASSLWSISDIVIRATNSDGNSITIKEALSCKTKVIASDCIERPDNVFLFKTRDVNDLIEKTISVLHCEQKIGENDYDNSKYFKNIYLELF